MGEFVRLEVQDGVGVVRLDRPPANALDHQAGLELQDAFGEAAERDDVGALVVWGGPRIFAAGADIKAMVSFGPEEIAPVVAALGDALDILEAMPKVSIAAINGYALGGGFELALAADLRYLAEDGKVGQPEIGLGVIPGAGGTQRLTQLVGPGRARELVYSGRQVASDEAADLGLVELDPAPRRRVRRSLRGCAGAGAWATGGDRGREGGDQGRHGDPRRGRSPG